jgi:hypothetical protein
MPPYIDLRMVSIAPGERYELSGGVRVVGREVIAATAGEGDLVADGGRSRLVVGGSEFSRRDQRAAEVFGVAAAVGLRYVAVAVLAVGTGE